MDKVVKVLFFRTSEREGGGLDFSEQLCEFVDSAPRAVDREYWTMPERNAGKLIRLESVVPDGDFISGNFCRIQTENIPPEVTDTDLQPLLLANGRGLGHQNAFLYHRPTRVMLWQQNRLGISFADLSVYLNKDFAQASFFTFEPVASDDAWEKFRANNSKKVTVKFAGERYVQPDDDQVIPIIAQARDIADRYRGLEVEITVSVGQSRTSFLDHRVLGLSIRRLLMRNDVKKLQVSTDGEIEEKNIDFLVEQLQNIREIDLPSDNPDLNYQRRRDFLRQTFNEQLDNIYERFRE